jgi:hypothetical protein
MKLCIVRVTTLSLLVIQNSPVIAWSVQNESTCRMTMPVDSSGSYGNEKLSVGGLWRNGTITFRPGGPGFVTSDGALGMKFGWTRGIAGRLRVTGRRVDGDARPLRLHAPDGYGTIGFQASYLIFPTPGCWEVTAQLGDHQDSRLTFITKVVKVGDGPNWRFDPR